MCGRFALGSSNIRIRRVFRGERRDLEWIEEDAFQPRYNIAPKSNAPVLRRRDAHSDPTAATDDDDICLHTMKWGVIPHWSKHEQPSLNTINARAENLLQSGGMWSSMKAKKRCIVICDGYFEWLKKDKHRIPHFIRRKDEQLMLLAGLYDCATLENSSIPIWTFAIVTTDASPTLSWLHDRQPVTLSSFEQADSWLDTKNGWHSGLVDLLKPSDGNASFLECYQVPKEVGRIGTNSPDFIKPISQRKDGIEALFSRRQKIGFEASTNDSEQLSEFSSSRKRKIETTEEGGGEGGEGEGEYEEKTSLPQQSQSISLSTPKKQRKSSPIKSPKVAKSPSNNSKITSFFQRK